MTVTRKSRWAAYPNRSDWGWQVVTPDGAYVCGKGYATETAAKDAAKREARRQDRLKRNREALA